MKTLSYCIMGLFVYENSKLIAYKLFKKDPELIAEKLDKLENKEFIEEIEELKGKFEEIKQTKYLRENFRNLALELKFVKSQEELNELINRVQIIRTKKKISSLQKRDKLIIQTISAINDLDRILNLTSERLKEWYGLHYPEFKEAHEKYASVIAEKGDRKDFEKFKTSMGMELEDSDIEILKEYALRIKELYSLRKHLEKYLNKIVSKEIPNLNSLLGGLLAARLLLATGSLEKLAKLSSSGIQTIGAEKAMFRHLKSRGKAKPPRFGILFVHPDISSAKNELRGKIARLLASKLTLAARADFYSKQDISKQLLEDYKKKLKKISG